MFRFTLNLEYLANNKKSIRFYNFCLSNIQMIYTCSILINRMQRRSQYIAIEGIKKMVIK